MGTKNEILSTFAKTLLDATNSVNFIINGLGENKELNVSIISTMYPAMDNIRALTTLLQNELDKYTEG